MVPRIILTRSGLILLNTARPVNTVQPRTAVNNAGPMKNVINNAYSTARRPFDKITAANNSNFTKKVNTIKGTKVNTARPKAVLSVVKGNKGNTLTDETHVLLKVPRKDNMYSVDLKNVVPQGGLTCLFAKATPDESNLWHRRLGHVNFKTMNKLVKRNLVRGIENLIDLRVKVIRCDNGTEFKNRVMNQLCEMKGIKREFSVARTPQQTDRSRKGKFDGKANEWGRKLYLWLFDIRGTDNKLMKFKPVVAGILLYGMKGIKKHVMLGGGKKDVEDIGNEDSEVLSIVESRINHEKNDNINNTNNINTTSVGNITYNVNDVSLTVNVVGIRYTQEEGIDYDEVFAHVSRIEAIRLFLAYASFKDFVVYQMDVKSAFLYGKIKEEVYVCQPPGFEDPDFPDRIEKIDKTLFIRRVKSDILLVQVYVDDIIFGSIKKSLCIEFEKMMHKKFQMSSMGELTFFLGLKVKQKEDDIFISQDKYVTKILKKFSFTDVKTASTPMETCNTPKLGRSGIRVWACYFLDQ
ncbi:putative ribonuclease H-like domain-containing protein [Tanacetum coccineum]